MGYVYILAFTFVVIDPAALLNPGNDAGGYAVAHLFYQVFKNRYGNGTGGILCLGLVAVTFCWELAASTEIRIVSSIKTGGLHEDKYSPHLDEQFHQMDECTNNVVQHSLLHSFWDCFQF